MQNSLPSGSCMTIQRWRPPAIWCSPTMDAPKATSRSTAEGSGSTKSKCMRFFATFGSGTFSKYQAGSVRAGSSPPMEAKAGPLPGSSVRRRASAQKAPTFENVVAVERDVPYAHWHGWLPSGIAFLLILPRRGVSRWGVRCQVSEAPHGSGMPHPRQHQVSEARSSTRTLSSKPQCSSCPPTPRPGSRSGGDHAGSMIHRACLFAKAEMRTLGGDPVACGRARECWHSRARRAYR